MKKNKKNLIKYIVVFSIIFFSASMFSGSSKAATQVYKPNLTITTTIDRSNYVVNDEIKVTYKIQPDPLEIKDINKIQDKEIVFVMDVSNSMDESLQGRKTRMDKLKEVSKNFIDKFKEVPNTKINLLPYGYKAINSSGFKNTSNKNEVKELNTFIDNMSTMAGTNIGDGLRIAMSLFSNNKASKKYMVFMSDGEPNGVTYTGEVYGEEYSGYGYYTWDRDREPGKKYKDRNWWEYYETQWDYYDKLNNDDDFKYTAADNVYTQKYALEYSKVMGKKIKESNITNFIISFGTTENTNKLNEISAVSGGTRYEGTDANAIDKVYGDIADAIKADYIVDGIKFNFTLPDNITYAGDNVGLTIDGKNYSKEISKIVYKLNNDKTKYIADPIIVELILKGNKSGNYNIGQGWNITYKGIDGKTITKDITPVDVAISNLNLQYDLSKKILNQEKMYSSKAVTMEYAINPKAISIPNGVSDKFEAENCIVKGIIRETLPEGIVFVDTGLNTKDIEVAIKYKYDRNKKALLAETVPIIKCEILPCKEGQYILNNSKFIYKDFEGVTCTREFNSVTINILDENLLNQGLFEENKENYQKNPGDNYVRGPINKQESDKNINVVGDSVSRLGSYIRTTGENIGVIINLRDKDNEGKDTENIKSINNLSFDVYEVNPSTNALVKVPLNKEDLGNDKVKIKIQGNGDNKYHYYIINYNFSIIRENKEEDGLLNIGAYIEGTDKISKIKVKVTSLPDLF